MRIIYLLAAILGVALAFGYSKKVGAALLIVIVLGMLLMAHQKGKV